MRVKSTFRRDNVKVDGDMRATLHSIIKRMPHSPHARRAARVLESGQRHIPWCEAQTYLGLLGAS